MDRERIKCGVPQGGSLSSLFFAIYINDLMMMQTEKVSYICYADDTCPKFDDVIDWSFIERSVAQVREWSRQNGLLLNAKINIYGV